MASYTKKVLTGLSDTFLGPATTNIFTDRENSMERNRKVRQSKINKYLEALGDDYETEISGFDEYGDPEYKAKKRKEKESKFINPKVAIQDALMSDENIPEMGKKLGLKEQVQGFPLADGGAVLPGPSGGEYDPNQMQTVKTPGYGDIVRNTLLERTQPGVPKEEAISNAFDIKQKVSKDVPKDFQLKIADVIDKTESLKDENGNYEEGMDPRSLLKQLIPLFIGNKEALDRLKLLMSLYPEM